ncbi:MAG: DUF4041 domain-containing protein [Deltaproteobacteria bacterium]|nr:DUF4041 domain-containing protein [Deltaproteobacteria bacterium]
MQAVEDRERQVEELKNKYSPIISIELELDRLRSSAEQARQETDEVRAQYAEKRSMLTKLEQQVAIYDERISFAELGVYEPHFDFGDSETYKESIKAVRERQKAMVSSKEATICPTDWAVDGSRSEGQTMVNRQIRLTMRAFNNECEAAIANTRWNNVVAMEKRILNAAKQIDNANASMSLVIHDDYVALKLDELHLTHEYRERLKVEKDERAELARAQREDKKLLADAEAAEREERRFAELLNKARTQAGVDESRIAALEAQLAAAQAESERARAMAQMTRSGYVYIVSNIGSFGDDVVKIGLTRRLDPDDRVRELGDASVPFKFDAHAMIYSDDAPALEAALHKEFSNQRINASNLRKEFFRVTLDEVEGAVRTLAPDASFFKDREAQEWHETLALRKQTLVDMQKASDEFPEGI